MTLPSWRVRALILVLAPSLSGWLSAQAPSPTVRDSAGVRIVEHATLKVTHAAFVVRQTPLADVGGLRDDPKEEFDSRTGINSAVRYSDGRIAVAEMFTVRVVRPSGAFVRVLGSRGGGPGQFDSQVSMLCLLRGDTLLVRAGRRIVLFDPVGNHIRTTAAEGVADGNCRADGTMVSGLWTFGQTTRNPSNSPTRVELRHLSREGRVLSSIGELAGTIGQLPFKVVEDHFSSGLGPRLVFADNGERAEVKAYSAAGKLVQIIRWRDPLIATTPSMLRALALRRLPTNHPEAVREQRTKEMLEGPQRPALPAYLSFSVDRVGRVWVRHYPQPPPAAYSPPAWTVFAEDGTLLGRFVPPTLPSGSRAEVVDAGSDFLVLKTVNRDEGVRVVVQSIVAAGAPSGR